MAYFISTVLPVVFGAKGCLPNLWIAEIAGNFTPFGCVKNKYGTYERPSGVQAQLTTGWH
jgi:hypothetical protein